MKKTVFLLVGAMTALMVQEASATAVFARQTGMACSSCHFQHFPLLNGFGRAFKSAGFAMVGAQGRVEGAALSIPDTLNMSVSAAAGYEKSDQTKAATPEKNAGDGVFYVPASGGGLSLYFGGRVSENAGFLGVLGTRETGASDIGGSAKMPVQYDVSSVMPFMPMGTRMGLVPFATDMQGASYGFEVLNTGANAVHLMSASRGIHHAHSAALSAQQFLGTDGAARGVAFVVSNPMGFINFTKFDRTGVTSGKLTGMDSSYLRVAGFIPLAGWEAVGFGAQAWWGESAAKNPAGLTPLVVAATEAYAFDAQLQGHLLDLPLGLYVSYARAPAVPADLAAGMIGNAYNTYLTQDGLGNPIVANGTHEKRSMNLSAELGLVPDVATMGFGVRRGTNGNGLSDNAVFLTGTYQVAQNVLLTLSLTSTNGEYWFSDPVTGSGTTDQVGKSTYTIDLTSAF